MKKIKSYCLFLTMMLTIISASATPPNYSRYFDVNGIQYYTFYVESGEAFVSSGDYSGDIVIPDSVSYEGYDYKVMGILESVFLENTQITSIDLGSITSLGSYAFKGCTALKTVKTENVSSMGRNTFEGCKNLTSVVLGPITSVPEQTFYKCSNLKSIDLKGVTSLGYSAFAHCTNLTEIDLTNISSIGSSAFEGCTALKTANLNKVEELPWYCFKSCTALTSVDLGKVKVIPYQAFERCSSLASINLKEVTSIESEAFKNCTSLQSLDFQNVSKILDGAFMNCTGLEYIHFGCITSIPNHAFENCTNLKSLDFQNVTTVGTSAFSGCTSLQSIDFGQMNSIQTNAFNNCKSLTSLDFKGVTSISDNAFRNCTGLTSLDLKHISILGANAFNGCTGLTTVDFGNVLEIPFQAFYGCTGLQSLDMKKVNTISSRGFDSCTGLTTIHLNHVKNIGDYAFSDCKGLQTITTHETTPPTVEKNTFSDINYFRTTLEVPVGYQSAYQNDVFWKLFANIKETIIPNTTQFTICCTENGSIQWKDKVFSNGTYTFTIPQGEQISLQFNPDEGARLYSVFANNHDITAKVQQLHLNLCVSEPLTLKVSFALDELILDDASGYYNKDTEERCDRLCYRRNFEDTTWQALYLPFAMSTSDWSNDFQFAQINDTRQYDDNQDGKADRTELEAFILPSGHPMEANTPYLIRTKTIGQKEISFTEVTLKKSEEKTYDCTSWFNRYLFRGTYQGISGEEMYHKHYYTLQEGNLQPTLVPAPLQGFRWYLSVEDRQGQPQFSTQKIKLIVFDENGNHTGMEDITPSPSHPAQWPADIYNLQGKLVKAAAQGTENLPQGIYIVNGQKLIIK